MSWFLLIPVLPFLVTERIKILISSLVCAPSTEITQYNLIEKLYKLNLYDITVVRSDCFSNVSYNDSLPYLNVLSFKSDIKYENLRRYLNTYCTLNIFS